MSDHEQAMMNPDPASFRTVLGHFATGVTIITASEDGAPVGVAANSFTSVSLDPPLVLFCAAKESSTWPRIRSVAQFCINILAEDQEDICRIFASPGADRFARIGYRATGATGSPLLHDVLAYVDCETEQEIEAGDHIIVIGRVLELGVLRSGEPLLFYRGGYGAFRP
jgi:3-hydroxy-9,10-secoandrosta-1,3,5(10)-triene-9,17-dione monooxygenase reductase component